MKKIITLYKKIESLDDLQVGDIMIRAKIDADGRALATSGCERPVLSQRIGGIIAIGYDSEKDAFRRATWVTLQFLNECGYHLLVTSEDEGEWFDREEAVKILHAGGIVTDEDGSDYWYDERGAMKYRTSKSKTIYPRDYGLPVETKLYKVWTSNSKISKQ
jgi:hypothetical protein